MSVSSEIHEVGCRQCSEGGCWRIFTNGKELVKEVCGNCGNEVSLKAVVLKTKPDNEVYDLRMFT